MSKTLIAAFATSLLLVGAGCASTQMDKSGSDTSDAAIGPSNAGPDAAAPAAAPSEKAPAAAPRTATISIKAIAGWSQSGTATLTDLAGNNTRIDIVLTGKDIDKALPAAIYAGSCATQQAEEQYALSPIVNGRSTTTLNVNIGALIDKSPQAIKIKRDATDTKLPLAACGELK